MVDFERLKKASIRHYRRDLSQLKKLKRMKVITKRAATNSRISIRSIMGWAKYSLSKSKLLEAEHSYCA